jgi:hypothetical protein
LADEEERSQRPAGDVQPTATAGGAHPHPTQRRDEERQELDQHEGDDEGRDADGQEREGGVFSRPSEGLVVHPRSGSDISAMVVSTAPG